MPNWCPEKKTQNQAKRRQTKKKNKDTTAVTGGKKESPLHSDRANHTAGYEEDDRIIKELRRRFAGHRRKHNAV